MHDLFAIHSSSLPDSARVMGFRGKEGLSRPYFFDVYLSFEASVGATIDPGDTVGSQVILGFKQELGEVPFLFHGSVAEMELVQEIAGPSGGGRSVFRVHMVPQLALLALSHHSRIFTKKSIPEIISAILEDNGISSTDYELRLSGAYPLEEHVCQYRESDLAFISRWMEHEGLYYFFEQGEAAEKLVITDDLAVHHPLIASPVAYHPAADDEMGRPALHFAALEKRTLAADVMVADYDYARPGLAVVGEQAVSPTGLAHVSIYGDRVFSPEAARRVAGFRAQSLNAKGVKLRARGTRRHLRSGYLFELEHHPRAELNRGWLVTEVEHIGKQIHGVTELDQLIPEQGRDVYRVLLSGMPSDVQFRSERSTPWPKIHGFENGVVDGANSSTYAQIDDHGRYAVKLRFDEGPLRDGQASTWVRMAQPHGGGLEGFHFPLRKATEVLLQFLDGDPDRPVIVAVLPNAATPSPVTSGNHTKNVMQTGGSTRMEIEDLGGGQYMHTTTPPQNTGMWMGTDATSRGGHNVEQSSDGSAGRSFGSYFDRFVGGTKAEHVVGDVTRNYDTNFSSTVTGNVAQTYAANQSTEVLSSASRTIVGSMTETVQGAVEKKLSSTWNLHVVADVTEAFQANHGVKVGGTQDVHVLAKGEGTHQVGLAATVNGALSKHVASSGYKLEAIPSANVHVVANVSIRADVEASLSAPATTVDGDASVDINAGATIDVATQTASLVGASLLRLQSGAKIEILGGEITIKGGTINVGASGKLTVAATGQAVAAAAGAMTINGGPSVEMKGGVIQLNLGGASPSGLGPLVDALLALDPALANKLAELQKAGWVIRYGAPGSGSYFDKARKIMVLDPSLASDPQGTLNEVGRLTDALQNPAQPLYGQEEPQSCVVASARMIAETQTGRNIPEGDLRTQSTNSGPGGYDAANGTDMTTADELLRANGVGGASEFGPLSVDQLQDATANGDPAMVRLQHHNPDGSNSGGHAIVVDGVVDNADGTRNILIRDPGPQGAGTQQSIPEDQFLNDYYGDGSNSTYDGRGITTNGTG